MTAAVWTVSTFKMTFEGKFRADRRQLLNTMQTMTGQADMADDSAC